MVKKLQAKDPSVSTTGTSAVSAQGTLELIEKFPAEVLKEDTAPVGKNAPCNKDTGEKSRLHQRSRGLFAVVSGGGNILYFNPIFKSESPSQVYMLMVRILYLELKDVPSDQFDEVVENYVLSYDNMCNIDKLKAAQEELPLPAPYNTMWFRIKKVIDRLHLMNHKDKTCQEKYNPDNVLPEGCNTMASEQLHAWLSRYKKVVNSMTQTHHLFYIHRMCRRRNAYSARCKRQNLDPVLPGINCRLAQKER